MLVLHGRFSFAKPCGVWYDNDMVSTLVVKIPKSSMGNEELVAVPRREYERLLKSDGEKKATFMGYETEVWNGKKYKVPAYQLHGKAAERLDMRVREGMREYRAGKTITASSVDKALRIYARKKNNKN